jgi:hypothetical protein
MVQTGLEGQVDLAVRGGEVKGAFQRDRISLVHHMDARDIVVRLHRVAHLDHDRDLGPIGGDSRELQDREMELLRR